MLDHLLEQPVGTFLIIVAVILIAPMLSKLLRLPGIIGLILGGVLVGPYVLGFLEREGALELLGTVGLIYLMFAAGAEIDLRQFNKVRNRALTFGALTFIIPQAVGTGVGLLLGYELVSSVLLGSIFASHTLIAFPIITRLGITRNEAVSITVGATIVTDIAALLVLAAVAGVSDGNVTAMFFVELLLFLLIYTAVILFAIPRLGRFFFKRFRASAVEFQFVLVVIFVAAFMAEMIGMEAMVGAFLAGLAINSTVPRHSAVMGRVLFIGEAFFIPIFLISIGLLINPFAFFTDTRTLFVSVIIVLTILVTKYLASRITGWLFHYTANEVHVMWGLSMAQAAATLAATLVGIRIGLLDEPVFNGIVTMMLVTCVLSPLLVEHYGQRLASHEPEATAAARGTPKPKAIFSRILIPVANPKTEDYLIQLAGILSRTTRGILMPLNVARLNDGHVDGLQNQQQLLEAASLSMPDTNVHPIRRIDSSISDGILSAAMEHDASSIIMGWSGQSSFSETIFGRMLDQVIWSATVPIFVGRLTSSINAKRQIVLIIPSNSITHTLIKDALNTAVRIAQAINVPLLVLADAQFMEDVCNEQRLADVRFQVEQLDTHVVRDVTNRVHPQDLVLVTTSGSQQWFQSSLGTIPEELAERLPVSLVVMRFPFS